MLGWDILGALNELPLGCKGLHVPLPVQCWEGWKRGAALQGDTALSPSAACLAGSSRTPCLTCILHPEPNFHCSWEKPHPFSTGWVFLFICMVPGMPAHVLVLKRHT